MHLLPPAQDGIRLFYGVLKIDIAEGPGYGTHQIPHRQDAFSGVPRIDRRLQGCVCAWRSVKKGACARDTFRTECSVGIQVLPDPPHTVNNGVVKIKDWIGRGDVEPCLSGTVKMARYWGSLHHELGRLRLRSVLLYGFRYLRFQGCPA